MSKNKILLPALITMLLWGSLFPMVKLGFTRFSVDSNADILLFAGIRFVICGSLICLFTAIRSRESYKNTKSMIFPVMLSGFFAITLHYAFTYLGLEMTDSSKTAIIKQIGSLFYVCFSFLFFKEDKPTVKKIIASLIGFFGILALNISSDGFSFSFGDIFILCASFCTVVSNVISKKILEKASPLTVTGLSQLFGGAVLLVSGLISGGSIKIGFNSSLLIIVYILAASTVSYSIWYGIVKKGELSKLFIIKFAEPVFACMFGALILGENILKIQYLISFLLISGSILLANVKKRNPL